MKKSSSPYALAPSANEERLNLDLRHFSRKSRQFLFGRLF